MLRSRDLPQHASTAGVVIRSRMMIQKERGKRMGKSRSADRRREIMMGGKASRDKGKRGEREVATLFRNAGFEARRGWQARAGFDEPDVIVKGLAVWLEVKLGKRPNIVAAMRQAASSSKGTDLEPMACTREDGGRWLATVDLVWLLDMLSMSLAPEPGTIGYETLLAGEGI